MSSVTNIMISLLEEQAALLHRHINVLKQQAAGADVESAAPQSVEVHKKKVKAPVDPNKPKRPLSGYQLFMADQNPTFKEKHPDSNATVIMTMVAKDWSTLNTDQKDKYLHRAEKLKETYLEELQEYETKKSKDIADGVIPAEAPVVTKVKAPKAAATDASSSSAAATKKAAPVPVAAPAAPAATPEKSKKHKRSDSDSSEAVIFAAVEARPTGGETDKKKKVTITIIDTFEINQPSTNLFISSTKLFL